MHAAFVLAAPRALASLHRVPRAMGARRPPASRPNMTAAAGVGDRTRAAIRDHHVMVFSKSWCPYCADVKGLFRRLDVEHHVWELDERVDGSEVQSFLFDETGQSTVPNVFIGGKHIGGCDDTMALQFEGTLMELVNGK